MGRCYSADLRSRVQDFVDRGGSRRAAARHYDVSVSFAIRLDARRRATGSLEPSRQGRPPGGGKLAAHREFVIARVQARPDISMPELAAELLAERGVEVHPSSLSRLLCQAGFTYKKTPDGSGAGAHRRR